MAHGILAILMTLSGLEDHSPTVLGPNHVFGLYEARNFKFGVLIDTSKLQPFQM